MANDTVVTGLTLVPLFEQITVYASFSGDDNQNNQAYIEYRSVGAITWKRGMETWNLNTSEPGAMIIDRRPNLNEHNESAPAGYGIISPNPYVNQARGVIFGLAEKTTYEVRVTFLDADGVTGSPITGTITTRDSNPSSTGPVKLATPATLATVLASMQPGDIISLQPGNYSGEILVTVSGLPNNYITLQSADENNKAIITGGRNNILIQASYIRIRGLDLRLPTGDPGSCVSVGLGSGPTPDSCIIERNIMTDPNASQWASSGVLLRNSRRTLIQDNLIQNTPAMPAGGQAFGIFANGTGSNGGGNVIRRNQIISPDGRLRDGIGDAGNFYVGAGFGPDAMMYRNYIQGPYDDSIELDGGNMNSACFENICKNVFLDERGTINGISAAPCVIGPLYLFRNIVSQPREGAHKMGSTNYGFIKVYHETIYMAPYGLAFSSGSNRITENTDYRNNLAHVAARVNGHYKNGGGDATPFFPPEVRTSTWDYDCLYATGDWNGWWYGINYPTLAALQAVPAYGPKSDLLYEPNGIDQNPLLTNPTADDFRLQAGSPAIDKALIILGINDRQSPWPYNGNAPDLGAIEYGTTVLAPMADFTYAPTEGVAPLTVQFTDASSGEINSRQWNFGDGGTSILSNPSHVFNTSGVYPIQLTVTGPAGSDTITKYVTVFSLSPVVLTLTTTTGGTTNPVPGQYNIDQNGSMQVSAIPNTSYRFVEWQENGLRISTVNPLTVQMATSNRTIGAVFEQVIVPPTEHVVSISVTGQGSTNPPVGTYTMTAGTFTIQAIPAQGYQFTRWEGVLTENPISNPLVLDVQENRSVVAVFSAVTQPPPSNAGVIVAGAGVIGILLALFRRH